MSKRVILLLIMVLFVFCQVNCFAVTAIAQIIFTDNQKKPEPIDLSGDKGKQITYCIDTLFKPALLISERKKTEETLLKLIDGYEFKEESVASKIGCTWSSPVNFSSAPQRRLIIAYLLTGTGHYIDFWILHESPDGVRCFPFRGSEKGCGHWQVLDDLDGDGFPEIIIKHFVGRYEGAGTIIVWPAIYRWDGVNYARADDKYPEYYAQNVVPEFKRILEQIENWPVDVKNYATNKRNLDSCKYFLEKALSISQTHK